jgi:hypothetical protein
MVLADTSVWIQHFRRGEPALGAQLADGLVLMHPFVSGELACGNLKSRGAILSDLNTLPSAELASHAEVLRLIEDRCLWGRGLGWRILDSRQETRRGGSGVGPELLVSDRRHRFQ